MYFHSAAAGATLQRPGIRRERRRSMRKRSAAWFLAVTSFAYVAHAGCAGTGVPAGSPGSAAPGERHYGYVMSQVSSAIVVIDAGTNEVVRRVKHADMVKPAGGRFHPSLKRYYAGGSGKVT